MYYDRFPTGSAPVYQQLFESPNTDPSSWFPNDLNVPSRYIFLHHEVFLLYGNVGAPHTGAEGLSIIRKVDLKGLLANQFYGGGGGTDRTVGDIGIRVDVRLGAPYTARHPVWSLNGRAFFTPIKKGQNIL